MAGTLEEDAPWADNDELADHYWQHHWDMDAHSILEYDASARATIRDGTRFTYNQPGSGQPRVGYFDSATGLFTALRGDGIVS
jgi:hypothetical protein